MLMCCWCYAQVHTGARQRGPTPVCAQHEVLKTVSAQQRQMWGSQHTSRPPRVPSMPCASFYAPHCIHMHRTASMEPPPTLVESCRPREPSPGRQRCALPHRGHRKHCLSHVLHRASARPFDFSSGPTLCIAGLALCRVQGFANTPHGSVGRDRPCPNALIAQNARRHRMRGGQRILCGSACATRGEREGALTRALDACGSLAVPQGRRGRTRRAGAQSKMRTCAHKRRA